MVEQIGMEKQCSSFAEMHPGVQRVHVDLMLHYRFRQIPPLPDAVLYREVHRLIRERLEEWLRGNDAERKLQVVFRELAYEGKVEEAVGAIIGTS